MKDKEEIRGQLEVRKELIERRGNMAEDAEEEGQQLAALQLSQNRDKHKMVIHTLEYVLGERDWSNIGKGCGVE